MSKETETIISRHESNVKYITVDGIKTFYLDAGSDPVVFCIHGVPASSFLYRKVVRQLQLRELRAIAIDLPGLGLLTDQKVSTISSAILETFATAF